MPAANACANCPTQAITTLVAAAAVHHDAGACTASTPCAAPASSAILCSAREAAAWAPSNVSRCLSPSPPEAVCNSVETGLPFSVFWHCNHLSAQHLHPSKRIRTLHLAQLVCIVIWHREECMSWGSQASCKHACFRTCLPVADASSGMYRGHPAATSSASWRHFCCRP